MSEAVEVAPGLRVQADDEAGVHTWWLHNEARRNAVSPEALAWIAARCPELEGQVVVLRGAGHRAFCAGFDLTALAKAEADGSFPDAPLIGATAAMVQASATFVAAIGGYAIGAGVELACACDLRLATRRVFFGIPAAELGVVYHAAGLTSIHATFGPAGARRLLLLGERLSAEEAWSMGALVRLVDDHQALEQALAEVVTRLRAGAPLSIGGNRALLRALDRGQVDEPLRQRHQQQRLAAYRSEDHDEARRARVEGRPPRFRGR